MQVAWPKWSPSLGLGLGHTISPDNKLKQSLTQCYNHAIKVYLKFFFFFFGIIYFHFLTKLFFWVVLIKIFWKIGAITGAQTQGAVLRSKLRGRVRTQTHSSSPMKGSTYTLPTHFSHSTTRPRTPAHLWRSPGTKPQSHAQKTVNMKPKRAREALPLTLTRTRICSPAHSPTNIKNLLKKSQTHKGCFKMWCHLWLGTLIHQVLLQILLVPPTGRLQHLLLLYHGLLRISILILIIALDEWIHIFILLKSNHRS